MESKDSDIDVSQIEAHDTNGEVEELLAIGGTNAQAEMVENCNQEASPLSSTEEPELSSARMPTDLTRLNQRMSCSHCNPLGRLDGEPVETECRFCRVKKTNNARANSASEFDKSVTNPVRAESDFRNLPSSYAERLPSLPDTSLEDGVASINLQQQVEPLMTRPPRQDKTQVPSENSCHLFVRTPSPGLMTTMFLFERSFPEEGEKVYTLYMIPDGECQIYEEIRRDNSQQHDSRQMSFSVNNGSIQEYHKLYLQNEERITVSFEIENRYQQNFVAPDERREFVFRCATIESESQNRVQKGAKSSFCVQYVGEPGITSQERGIITLTINSRPSKLTTLSFAICNWSSVGVRANEEPEQDEI